MDEPSEEENMASADLVSIREWFAYNEYVRKKYLKVLESLSEDQLTKDRGASKPADLGCTFMSTTS